MCINVIVTHVNIMNNVPSGVIAVILYRLYYTVIHKFNVTNVVFIDNISEILFYEFIISHTIYI